MKVPLERDEGEYAYAGQLISRETEVCRPGLRPGLVGRSTEFATARVPMDERICQREILPRWRGRDSLI
jgi:hypothetical protein